MTLELPATHFTEGIEAFSFPLSPTATVGLICLSLFVISFLRSLSRSQPGVPTATVSIKPIKQSTKKKQHKKQTKKTKKTKGPHPATNDHVIQTEEPVQKVFPEAIQQIVLEDDVELADYDSETETETETESEDLGNILESSPQSKADISSILPTTPFGNLLQECNKKKVENKPYFLNITNRVENQNFTQIRKATNSKKVRSAGDIGILADKENVAH